MRGGISAVLGVLVLTMSLASQALPPDHIVIDTCIAKRSAVEFPHAAHFEVAECSSCHHTQEGLSKDSTEQGIACGECHNEPEKAGTPACGEMSLKKNQYHINCVSCHKEKDAGPTKCSECHPKN
jgi:hypothetical protein